MLLQASKLGLLPPKAAPPPSSSTASVSSLLFEPTSRSLAVMLSNSSLLLYPSFAPTSPSREPTFVPPVSTAFAFLCLLPSPASAPPGRVLLLSSSPHATGSATLLRAWSLAPAADRFVPAPLGFKRHRGRPSLVLDIRHGLSVQLAGSVNVLVLHSLAAGRIWVMAAKAAEGDGVDLVKCSVIECTLPIYSITVSMGFLLLGEVGGVRVFPLPPLIKRRAGRGSRGPEQRRMSGDQIIDQSVGSCKKGLANGIVLPVGYAKSSKFTGCCNGDNGSGSEGAAEGCGAPSKIRTVKLRQTSGDLGSFFALIRSADFHNRENGTGAVEWLKAVSIHAIFRKKFLILDSVGDLHLLSLHNIVISTEAPDTFYITSENAKMFHLDHFMKAQMVAVRPDLSARSQVVWISDGGHSVHMLSLSDIECPVKETEGTEKAIQVTAVQTIFTSEKIQDIVPLVARAILVLGQGSIFAYTIA